MAGLGTGPSQRAGRASGQGFDQVGAIRPRQGDRDAGAVAARATVTCRVMSRTEGSAAYAANWRTVLVVDSAVGFTAVIAGMVLAVTVTVVVGVLLVVAGAGYGSLVAVRARRWARLRRQAGL